MNCTQAQDQLAGLLYGDLPCEEKAALEKHIEECSACRHEYAALREVRKLLNRVPAPEGRLDLPVLYRQAADRRARSVRFWRRSAVACCATAAALATIAVMSRMEIRLEPHQVVLRWGSPPTGAQAVPVPQEIIAQPQQTASPETEAQLRLLGQLVHALTDTAEARDFRRQQELVQLRSEIGELQRRTAQWRRDTERDVDALYLISVNKGEKP
jgi:hypothetical protein